MQYLVAVQDPMVDSAAGSLYNSVLDTSAREHTHMIKSNNAIQTCWSRIRDRYPDQLTDQVADGTWADTIGWHLHVMIRDQIARDCQPNSD